MSMKNDSESDLILFLILGLRRYQLQKPPQPNTETLRSLVLRFEDKFSAHVDLENFLEGALWRAAQKDIKAFESTLNQLKESRALVEITERLYQAYICLLDSVDRDHER